MRRFPTRTEGRAIIEGRAGRLQWLRRARTESGFGLRYESELVGRVIQAQVDFEVERGRPFEVTLHR